MMERFGYVRRMARTGEAWHIVQSPPTADGMDEDGPTLCGLRPPGVGSVWGTIVSRAPWMKVCSRCDRVRSRSQAAQQETFAHAVATDPTMTPEDREHWLRVCEAEGL